MAQKSYFFDSVDHDRIYSTADFARVFGAIAGRDGAIYGYGEELTVSPGSGMTVKVGTGAAFVQGRMLEVYDQAETLPVTAAHATNPRIDRVVVRVDLSTAQRRAYLAVKTGTPAATPAAPLLQQDSTVWEMSLAQVLVGAGATSFVAGDITDEREYTEIGNVADNLAAHEAQKATPGELGHIKQGVGNFIDEHGVLTTGDFKAVMRTRDISLTTNLVVTGIGFKPRAIMFLATVPETSQVAIGFIESGSVGMNLSHYHSVKANAWTRSANAVFVLYEGSNRYYAYMSSFDDDGFTLNFNLGGAPEGTATIQALCFR